MPDDGSSDHILVGGNHSAHPVWRTDVHGGVNNDDVEAGAGRQSKRIKCLKKRRKAGVCSLEYPLD